MSNKTKSPWNSLEVMKLFASLLTPLLLFWLGYVTNSAIRESDDRRRVSEERKHLADSRQAAIQTFSRFIYERRSRSQLLDSSLKRHGTSPVSASYDEVVERKRLYDEAFFRWNANHQANLLFIRQVLGQREYTIFEKIVEDRLVLNTFKPLDTCLTRAWDAAIRKEDPRPILNQCDTSGLLQKALDCGYAITDELYKLVHIDSEQKDDGAIDILDQRCPSSQMLGEPEDAAK